jgi:hypothetical protein
MYKCGYIRNLSWLYIGAVWAEDVSSNGFTGETVTIGEKKN